MYVPVNCQYLYYKNTGIFQDSEFRMLPVLKKIPVLQTSLGNMSQHVSEVNENIDVSIFIKIVLGTVQVLRKQIFCNY